MRLKFRFRFLTLCAFLLSSAGLAQAQEPTPVGARYAIAASHDGANTDTYRLYRDGVAVLSKPVSALSAGTIQFDEPLLPVGTYTYLVAAVKTDPALPGGEVEARSAPFQVRVYDPTPPAPPTGVRIIRVVATADANGVLTLKLVSVE